MESNYKSLEEIKKRLNFFSFFLLLFLSFSLEATSFNKNQITYLMQAKEIDKSIDLYWSYKKSLSKHDFEVLQQMAYLLLELGARSADQETQLLAIYGSGIANVASSLDILEAGVKSSHAETQIASIQFLGGMHDDRCDELLVKAMSSEFFPARMEAAMHLATRKHKTSVGQIESLMYRIPPEGRFFFPQFFALIGTPEAMSILKHLMEDKNSSVRVEALVNSAKFGRDDLLPIIRMNITHLNIAEAEAAAYAIGILRDTKSLKKLKSLFNSSPMNVKIAAALALHMLGDSQAKEFILSEAKKENLNAIVTLASIPEGKELLATLCNHSDFPIRINAAMSLLKLHDPRCRNVILEILVKNPSDLGLVPQFSIGKTILAFKPTHVSSSKDSGLYDVRQVTHTIRQQILLECLHLEEDAFLTMAEILFERGQSDLVPTLTTLLENLQTPKAIDLLKRRADQAGMPLIRAYCNLALYRLGQEGPYEKYIKEWIQRNKDGEMIRFKPTVPLDQRVQTLSSYELTPEDNSRLLIEMYQTLAERQQNTSIDILLDAIKNGNPKNRYVLAGLLLKALQ